MNTKLGLWILVGIFSLSAQAATTWKYNCKPAGQRKDEGTFAENRVRLTVTKKTAKLEAFDQGGGVAPSPEPFMTLIYSLGKVVGGSGKVAGYTEAHIDNDKSHYSGDAISPLFLSAELLTGGKDLDNGGKGGLFTFTAGGYAYDWNMCFRD